MTSILVMPVSYFTLLWAFLQSIAVQLFTTRSSGRWARSSPAWWPRPASRLALLRGVPAALDGRRLLPAHVLRPERAGGPGGHGVQVLLNMFQFVAGFVSGLLVPVALMPAAVRDLFALLFPYWTINAPVELLLGRLGHADFLRGLAVMTVSLAALELLAVFTWRRGLGRYAGVGT
ncbi:MAG: ABC-2 family transporter protein [bacterium]